MYLRWVYKMNKILVTSEIVLKPKRKTNDLIEM